MRKHILTLLSFLLIIPAFSQGSIQATVTNFRSGEGVCRACLFTSASAFAGGGDAFKCIRISIKDNKASLFFEDVPEGNYAIALFHDVNNNGALDRNFLGIPKEGYGASKNKLPFAAAPKFEENKFYVPNKAVIHLDIRLRYLL